MAKRTRLLTTANGLIPPAELFARPGEDITINTVPPLTPDERIRERVAAAWAWVKAVRFYEHEHGRLREVLVEMIEGERRGGKAVTSESPIEQGLRKP